MVDIIEEKAGEDLNPGSEDQEQDQEQVPSPDEQNEENETDEVSVSFGESEDSEQSEDEPDNSVIREFRKRHADMKRQNRELREKIQKYEQPAVSVSDPGPKPSIESCEYDSERYEREFELWNQKKNQIKEEQAKVKQQQDNANRQWQEKIQAYNAKKEKINVSDYDVAESIVNGELSATQQAIIVQGSKDPAMMVYALGKNHKKIAELAKIDNYIDFAFEVARLEAEMKIGKRKPPAAPEKVISGNLKTSGAVDSQLERLRAEAEKTNNYTKVIEYKKRRKSVK